MLDSGTLKLTTLSENTVANTNVGGEWGLTQKSSLGLPLAAKSGGRYILNQR